MNVAAMSSLSAALIFSIDRRRARSMDTVPAGACTYVGALHFRRARNAFMKKAWNRVWGICMKHSARLCFDILTYLFTSGRAGGYMMSSLNDADFWQRGRMSLRRRRPILQARRARATVIDTSFLFTWSSFRETLPTAYQL